MEVGTLTRRGEKVKLKPEIVPTEFEEGIAVDRIGPATASHETCKVFWLSSSPFTGTWRPYTLGTTTVAGIAETRSADVGHACNTDMF